MKTMSECSSNGCSSCESNGSCSSQQQQQQNDMLAKLNPGSHVKHVIGVVSGKGGVGKSLVTSLMAITMARKGFKTAILDADITGPSIPKVFGVNKEKAGATDMGILPVESKGGVKIMSVNLLLEDESDPVLWRGPILGNIVKQFYSDTVWGDVDYMFVDMPPGTGDVPLTVYQSLNVDGIIIVTSPQDLVSMIVEKAVKMADLMQIPIYGIIENYSYFHCPDNGIDYKIFGDSHVEDVLKKHDLMLLGRLPIDPKIAELCDKGALESIDKTMLENIPMPE